MFGTKVVQTFLGRARVVLALSAEGRWKIFSAAFDVDDLLWGVGADPCQSRIPINWVRFQKLFL